MGRRLAALAFAVSHDAVDNAWICNDGDNLHARPTATQQRVNLENLPQQPGPCPAGLLGEVRVLVRPAGFCSGTSEILHGLGAYSCPVVVGSVVPLIMLAGIGDMGRDAVDPLRGSNTTMVAPVRGSGGVCMARVVSSRFSSASIAKAGRVI